MFHNKLVLQYSSDIHLEFYKMKSVPRLKPMAPYLSLCGDIGYPFSETYKKFIKQCSDDFKQVFIVSGNHEYYQSKHRRRTMTTIDTEIKKIASNYNNVHYLQRQAIILNTDTHEVKDFTIPANEDSESNKSDVNSNEFIIAGTTLWSHLPSAKYAEIGLGMNDYHQIYVREPTRYSYDTIKTCLITPLESTILHHENVAWIKSLTSCLEPDVPVVMITHHLPSILMIPDKYRSHPLNCAYATDLSHLMDSQIRAWLCGHSHSCKTVKIGNTVCSSNARGYIREYVPDYNPEKIIVVQGKQRYEELDPVVYLNKQDDPTSI